MSLQDMADKAVAGLAKQGFARSLAGWGQCQFRGDSGMKCAIGHVLEDNEIVYTTPDPTIEFAHDTNRKAASKYDVTLEEIVLLQGCHDCGYKPEEMKRLLVKFYLDNNLILPDVLK